MRILVVEDEKDLNNIITKHLKKNNFSVDSVFNGEEALEYLDYGTYDLIVLDIMLPKVNGYEVVKKLRENKNETAVLMLTARDSIEDKIKGLDLGADDYLIKPFDFGETSLDAKQLSTSGATVREVTSGCICCSLQGNFKNALIDILSTQDIDQIYIEPSGVSKLSEILYTCDDDDITSKAYVSMIITVVDAMQAPMAIKNFGPFFKDQIKHCYAILLTHVEDEKQVEKTKQLIIELAPHTPIYTDVDALQQDINQLKSNTHKAHEHDSETCSCHTCNDSEDYNGAHHDNHSHHDHDVHHHEHQPFVTHTFHNLQSLDDTQWIDFCNNLPSTILRIKGIIPTASGPMELQYTPQSCAITATHLNDYHLVVIGTEIDIPSINEKVCSAS